MVKIKLMDKTRTLPKRYDPSATEQKWYAYWIEKGYFTAKTGKKPKFSIVIPPPNVTGSLHMGHALNNTLQDIVTRFKRMQGYNTLWLPGTDHAGIATQNVVERELLKEGKKREDLGREKFLERVWKWKETYGNRIIEQLKRLGASCDWSRLRFTMDEGFSKAVRHVFVKLWEEGLLYRGKYIVNWCPRCKTALADIEVEYEPREGRLWYIKYPFKENPQEGIVVATTRPETMLGDTAVAVHPKDERYKSVVGKTVILPIKNREIPIIADNRVDPDFGTGAVKVTPAHDPLDFLIGQDHKLEAPQVIDGDAKMTEEAGDEFKGLDRYEARKKVIEKLKELGLLLKEEKYEHGVGVCYRCKTDIEPLISQQWFIKMKPLAEPAIKVVKEGKIKIIPKHWTKTYFEWMENIRDWCISRQIWWGHQIPAWYCPKGHITVSEETPQKCQVCGSTQLEQDPDVLDTWFSSALWPFGTLGWPEETEDLKTFYPTDLLVTGFDILFFWVARMIMMGLKFAGDIPFKDVYIHALVRDEKGQKMSKSKGNVIDPVEMIEKYGADALRFTLTALAAQGRDIKLSVERIEGYRHFINKLWNASRFILMNLKDYNPSFEYENYLEWSDRWILNLLNKTIKETTQFLETYEFDRAAATLYEFVWHNFCDWYIEISKERLYGDNPVAKNTVQKVLLKVLTETLKLLHPIIPFITEEIYQLLPEHGESIVIEKWPESQKFDEKILEEFETLKEIVRTVRNLRALMGVHPRDEIEFYYEEPDFLKQQRKHIERLTRGKYSPIEQNFVSDVTSNGIEVRVKIVSAEAVKEQIEKLREELKEVEELYQKTCKNLENASFLTHAPEEVIQKEFERKEQLEARISKIKGALRILGG